MDIEYGMSVVDKNGKSLGSVDHIVMDSWSGEPRKFIVRLDDEVSAVYFSPDNVAELTKGKVKLNLTFEEMEQT
jgi:sporulation protein YlmC with PRC-barrel domain